jgi:hypothetical protein
LERNNVWSVAVRFVSDVWHSFIEQQQKRGSIIFDVWHSFIEQQEKRGSLVFHVWHSFIEQQQKRGSMVTMVIVGVYAPFSIR